MRPCRQRLCSARPAEHIVASRNARRLTARSEQIRLPPVWQTGWFEGLERKEFAVRCIDAKDPQLTRLAQAIAHRVGAQRFHVWFNNSTRLDIKNDGLEIAVPNDFISEWIGRNFTRPIEDASQEVMGCRLPIRFAGVTTLRRYYETVRPCSPCRYFRPRGAAACAFSLCTAEQVLKFRTSARIRVTPPVPRTPHSQ